MRTFLTIVALVIITSLTQSVYAQIGSAVVGYDPLFWKAELRLSTEQCMQLRDINAEFYKAIVAAAHDHAKWDADRLRIVELLNSRSERIMQIFTERQRKKWDKIASTFRGNIVASADLAPGAHWARF